MVGILLIVVVPAFLAGLLVAAVVGKCRGPRLRSLQHREPAEPHDGHPPARLSDSRRDPRTILARPRGLAAWHNSWHHPSDHYGAATGDRSPVRLATIRNEP